VAMTRHATDTASPTRTRTEPPTPTPTISILTRACSTSSAFAWLETAGSVDSAVDVGDTRVRVKPEGVKETVCSVGIPALLAGVSTPAARAQSAPAIKELPRWRHWLKSGLDCWSRAQRFLMAGAEPSALALSSRARFAVILRLVLDCDGFVFELLLAWSSAALAMPQTNVSSRRGKFFCGTTEFYLTSLESHHI
jgi:hypothetical protein